MRTWLVLGLVLSGCLEASPPDAGASPPGNDDAGADAGADAGMVDGGWSDAAVLGWVCSSEAECAVGEGCLAGACVAEPLHVVFPQSPIEVGSRPRTVDGFIVRADGGIASGIRLPRQVELSPRAELGRPLPGETAPIDSQGRFEVSVAGPPDASVAFSTIIDARADPAEAGELSVSLIPKGNVFVELFSEDGGPVVGARRRDEVLIARLRGARGLVSLDGVPSAFRSIRDCGCGSDETDAGRCRCFEIELWVPPLPAVEGRVPFEFYGTDTLGNVSRVELADGGPFTIDVTRMHWAVTPRPTLGHIFSATPVLDDDGVLYIGNFTNQGGGIVAIAPDGTIKWQSQLHSYVNGLAFSRGLDPNDRSDDVLFYTANSFVDLRDPSDGGRVGAVSPATGSPIPGECDFSSAGGTAPMRRASTIALIPRSTDAGEELAAIGRFDATTPEPGALCEWAPSMGSSAVLQPLTGDAPDPVAVGNVFPPAPDRAIVVARATSANAPFEVVYPTTASFEIKRRIVFGVNSLSPSYSMTPQPHGGWARWPPATGFTYVGGASNTSSGSFAMTLPDEVWVVPQNTSHVSSQVSQAVVDRLGRMWFSADNAINWLDTATGARDQLPLRVNVALSSAEFVLTEDAAGASDRLLGFSGGYLLSIRVNPPTLEWVAPTIWGSSMHVTYDCNRRVTGRAREATGILYGYNTASIAALIMDAPRLDRQAIWPKPQHDAFNSSNTSLRFDNCR